jgi:hypothetical protein
MPCIGRQLPEKSIITAALLRVVWCKTKLIRGRVAVLQYESPPHCPIHTIFIRPEYGLGEGNIPLFEAERLINDMISPFDFGNV